MMKTKLTLFVAVLFAFSVNLAYSQTKPKEEIFPSGTYEMIWDGAINDRLDAAPDRLPSAQLELVVKNNKISGKGIGEYWRDRNIVFTGEIMAPSKGGISFVVLKSTEKSGNRGLNVFRGLPGKPLRGVWYATNGTHSGDIILLPFVKDRNLKKPKGE
mgnify:CR=1 FL=1